MGFDIPMNTTGCMGASDLLNLNNGGMPQSQSVSQPVTPQMNPSNQSNTPVSQPNTGTGVILKKGQKVNLTGTQGGSLTNVRVGLGWDVINQACDLDASAFMLGENGKVIGDDWFVFYGQTK